VSRLRQAAAGALDKLPGPPAAWLGGAAALATLGLIGFGVTLLTSGGGPRAPIQLPKIAYTHTSWIQDEPALTDYAAFAAVFGPAALQGQQRSQAYAALLALIEQRKKEAQQRARERAKKRYDEERRKALARYREALRRAAELRRKIEAENRRRLAEQRRKEALHRLAVLRYQKAKREYEEALKVHPGTECNLPEVREFFSCGTGRTPTPPLPTPHKKKKKGSAQKGSAQKGSAQKGSAP
jgi:tetratricopeptide (TPR) repeat protein